VSVDKPERDAPQRVLTGSDWVHRNSLPPADSWVIGSAETSTVAASTGLRVVESMTVTSRFAQPDVHFCPASPGSLYTDPDFE
jgi:hypothetical protein